MFSCLLWVLCHGRPEKRADSEIWLLNPFTRNELRFSRPPNPYSFIILASLATPLWEYVIIAFDRWSPFSGQSYNSPWWFVDGVVFKGKIYVLTDHGEIGVLNLNSHPYVTLLEIHSIGCSSFELNLLGFDEQLFMIHRIMSIAKKEAYELNFQRWNG